ncbi:MAG: uncharacterized protein JWL80_131 [Parcubacteria group bacterium]|nr:uncharacterized protein [Parcubacteria group bacterium]
MSDTLKVPTDLRKVLASSPKMEAIWKDLTPISRRDFISWIESAKQPETRTRRIEVTKSKLLSGQRRPCCYAVVPMNLYKALDKVPKAKAVWKDLSPNERRDFADWIEAVKDTKVERINKACMLLSTGKRHP